MIAQRILEERPAAAFMRYLALCDLLGSVDTKKIAAVARSTIRYLQASAVERQELRLEQSLEQRWYAALEAGQPDYSVYGSDLYLADLWACWIVYSRRYLLGLSSNTVASGATVLASLGNPRSIVDLGCGIGFTTAALAGLFPGARVEATNLEDITQTRIARMLGSHYGFIVAGDIQALAAPADLLFASEYFEHIHAPVAHLSDVLERFQPRALLIANTFTARSIGHFDLYSVAGQPADGRATARAFSSLLERNGYRKVKTTLWNDRPAYWRLEQHGKD
jgi:SAM-dependent methyltransferase